MYFMHHNKVPPTRWIFFIIKVQNILFTYATLTIIMCSLRLSRLWERPPNLFHVYLGQMELLHPPGNYFVKTRNEWKLLLCRIYMVEVCWPLPLCIMWWLWQSLAAWDKLQIVGFPSQGTKFQAGLDRRQPLYLSGKSLVLKLAVNVD